MSAALEHGVVPGGSLLSLEQLIHEVTVSIAVIVR